MRRAPFMASIMVLVGKLGCAGQGNVVAPGSTITPSAPGSSRSPAAAASSPANGDVVASSTHATLRIDSSVSFDVTLTYDDGLTWPLSVAAGHSELAVPAGKMRWDRSWSGACQNGGERELDAELLAGKTLHLTCSQSMTLQNNLGLCCGLEAP